MIWWHSLAAQQSKQVNAHTAVGSTFIANTSLWTYVILNWHYLSLPLSIWFPTIILRLGLQDERLRNLYRLSTERSTQWILKYPNAVVDRQCFTGGQEECPPPYCGCLPPPLFVSLAYPGQYFVPGTAGAQVRLADKKFNFYEPCNTCKHCVTGKLSWLYRQHVKYTLSYRINLTAGILIQQ